MSDGMPCKFCGRVWDPQTDYRKVEGWERFTRSQGGTNALRVREPKPQFACMFCVENLAKGRSTGQLKFG